MGELVNLNRARKARDRAAARAQAALNRASHGRTGGERSRTEAEAKRLDHALDGARREDSAPEGSGHED